MKRTSMPRSVGLLLSFIALAAPALAQRRTFTDVANVPLPDNGCTDDANGTGEGGIARTIVINAFGTIADADVEFRMTHPFRSDIQASIFYSPAAGPGVGPKLLMNADDSSGDNYFATFNSDNWFPACASLNACGSAANCESAPGPVCQPNGTLAALNGANFPGAFILKVCDRAAADLGTLIQWSVVVNEVVLTFDIDSNGSVDPLTDGLLTLRHQFGFRGATLIAGAVAGNCGRCSAGEIEKHLDSL